MRTSNAAGECYYCHHRLNPGVSTCPYCGLDQPAEYRSASRRSKPSSVDRCVYCNYPLIPGMSECPNCGREQPVRPKRKKKKKSGCGLVLAVLFMAAVAAVIFYVLPTLKQRYAGPEVISILPTATETPYTPGAATTEAPAVSAQDTTTASAATHVPASTPTPVPTATARLTEASTAVPTAVPTVTSQPVKNGSESVSEASEEPTGVDLDLLGMPVVKTAADLEALLDWMISSCTLSVKLSISSRLDESTLNRVMDMYAFPHTHWTCLADRVTEISISLYTGEKIWYAAKNGKTDLLDASEEQLYRTALGVVLKKTGSLTDDFEKELVLHDYVIKNCTYEVNEALGTDSCEGFFNHGKCQCSGYADTFALLCRLAGIDAMIASGTSKEEGASHAWNLVKLENKWYLVDCTYDDPTGGTETHVFFNVPPKFLDGERTMESKGPDTGSYAKDWDSNYWYIRYGYYAKNRDGAVEVLRSQLDAGTACLMLGKKLDLGDLTDKVLRNTKYKGWSYTTHEIGGNAWVYDVTFTK